MKDETTMHRPPAKRGGLRIQGKKRQPFSQGPLISIVTVVRNGERHLGQAIQSVLSQSYDNIEYIIVDGGSTDRTLEIIRSQEDLIDLWVSESDRGIYDAMNKGIGLATGDLIGLLNCDDWYADGALSEVAAVYAATGGKSSVIAGKWHIVFDRMNFEIEAAPSLRFQGGMPLCHQAMFVPISAYKSTGSYDTGYRYAADLDMVLRMYVKGIPFVFSDKVLAYFRATGSSDRYFKESVREASKIIRKYLPYPTYLAYRITRMKFEILNNISRFIEKKIGQRSSDYLKSVYFRGKARVSSSWKIEKGAGPDRPREG